MTLPTACGETLDTYTTAVADSWQDPGEWVSELASFPSMTGCDRLSFEPAIGVAPELPRAYTPSGYGLELHVPQDEEPEGLATSQLQGAQLTLPAGVSLSLAYLDSAESCTEAQIELQSNEPASCPNPSTLGRVEIDTPLLSEPLKVVYIALKLYGGANSVLDNPQACGQVTATGQLTPWDGGAQTAASSSFEVEPAHAGETCPARSRSNPP